MAQTKTLGSKIVHHIFNKLDPFYFNDNYDYPEVVKGAFSAFDKDREIYVVRNAKGQLKISSSDKYGVVVLSYVEILELVMSEMNTERPKLNMLINKIDRTLDAK
jgi:hypothetical protein